MVKYGIVSLSFALILMTFSYGNTLGADTRSADDGFEPAYLSLHRSGELKERARELWDTMAECGLCPRVCRVDRLSGEKGFCGASADLRVSSYHPHFGEERPLVGRRGSGTIFFSHCGLRCVFCINWQVSHGGRGNVVSIEELAQMMLRLQDIGCHNINLVTPTHYLPHILLALDIAAGKGLRLPLVYNTCGWEHIEILEMLDGIVDIYLPDLKYSDNDMAIKYSAGADGYPRINRDSILEMYRQVGTARVADDGLIYRGLMVRHLIMPNNAGGTKEVIKWISENLPKDTYFNLMAQYRPMYKAFDHPEISRGITRQEYREAMEYAIGQGLTNLDRR